VSSEEGRLQREPDSAVGASIQHLSSEDVHRLTTYKWRYSLEAHGFSSDQAGRLLFMKWLYRQGSVLS
jgi:hypothetical protein